MTRDPQYKDLCQKQVYEVEKLRDILYNFEKEIEEAEFPADLSTTLDDDNQVTERLQSQCKQYEWKLLEEVERRQAVERELEEQKANFQNQLNMMLTRLEDLQPQKQLQSQPAAAGTFQKKMPPIAEQELHQVGFDISVTSRGEVPERVDPDASIEKECRRACLRRCQC